MVALNPFRPGAGTPPPYLAGREREQTRFANEVERAKVSGEGDIVVIYGPRGMGKTTLLGWLKDHCKERRVKAIMQPANELVGSVASLTRELAPRSRLFGEWALSKGAKNGGTEAALSKHLMARCRKGPLVLLVDEAHAAPDMKALNALLNAGQAAARNSPFLLVLAGTPGLEDTLERAGATFLERADRVEVGLLDEQSAAAVVREPMQAGGIRITPEALDHLVKDSQCYPYFLQVWGRALWEDAQAQNSEELTLDDIKRVATTVQQAKDGFYERRFRKLVKNKALLAAANAVAEKFVGGGPDARFDEVDVTSAIEAGLSALTPDNGHPTYKATELMEELNRQDFIWQRRGMRHFGPGIPSFIAYVNECCRKHPGLSSGKMKRAQSNMSSSLTSESTL